MKRIIRAAGKVLFFMFIGLPILALLPIVNLLDWLHTERILTEANAGWGRYTPENMDLDSLRHIRMLRIERESRKGAKK